ncbi:MAG: hypothetical protein POG74_09160 [Acidocella sp.]|nr:hypothetical protein [Acidocella sp.]
MSAAAVFIRNPEERYAITLENPEWAHTMGFLQCDPSMDGPPPRQRQLEIVAAGPFVQLREAGAAPRNFGSIVAVQEHLHSRLFMEALAGERAILHGACLLAQGRRVLLVGPKAAGKSTLTLALGLAGFAIEGDENLFVMREGVSARPRACRVKESSVEVLPALVPLLVDAPFVTDYQGRNIYNLPPDRLGVPWHIATGKVTAVIMLHANHGGMSSIRRLPPLLLTQALMNEMVFTEGKSAGIAGVAGLAAARGYDLSVGNLAAAVACVQSIMTE